MPEIVKEQCWSVEGTATTNTVHAQNHHGKRITAPRGCLLCYFSFRHKMKSGILTYLKRPDTALHLATATVTPRCPTESNTATVTPRCPTESNTATVTPRCPKESNTATVTPCCSTESNTATATPWCSTEVSKATVTPRC